MTNTTYVRWRPGEPRAHRAYPPLEPGHPSYGVPCAACDRPLGDGTQVQLAVIGPHDDESRAKHDQHRWYNAHAVVLHAACVRVLASAGALDAFLDDLTPRDTEPETTP